MSKVWLLMPFLLQGFATRGSWPVVFPSSGVSILVNTLKKAAKNMKKASSSSSLLSQIGSHYYYSASTILMQMTNASPRIAVIRHAIDGLETVLRGVSLLLLLSQLSPSMHLMQNCKAWNRSKVLLVPNFCFF